MPRASGEVKPPLRGGLGELYRPRDYVTFSCFCIFVTFIL